MNTQEQAPRPKPAPPKPRPPVAPPVEAPKPAAAKEKPKFVRKPHLTDRPLKGHEGLEALAKQMESKPTPRRGQRRTNKEKK